MGFKKCYKMLHYQGTPKVPPLPGLSSIKQFVIRKVAMFIKSLLSFKFWAVLSSSDVNQSEIKYFKHFIGLQPRWKWNKQDWLLTNIKSLKLWITSFLLLDTRWNPDKLLCPGGLFSLWHLTCSNRNFTQLEIRSLQQE